MPLPPHPVRVEPNEPSPSHAASAFNGGSADAKAPSPMSSQKGENLPFEKKANGTGLRRSARLDQLKINGQKQQKRPRSDEQAPAAPAKPTVKRSRRQHAHDVPVRRSQRIATSTTATKGREAAKLCHLPASLLGYLRNIITRTTKEVLIAERSFNGGTVEESSELRLFIRIMRKSKNILIHIGEPNLKAQQ
ncbi:hypothetical protein GLOTRDRAFT_97222 [Gloeophyllum trabeum ATCC 11539]|uniref:Uncharacterized protein n=1 Tax=Gloeophyllum trabeum (strain ATCC 11539 / FP-39264 / Madison 617) TaxID=670483 RepID=S7PRV8_GLOTA|nr:uncharacterized protein GLOTRDRAFT_97222 [Gloeophyllum trabeum ATCC 11539]EPQ50112.1 hypothetical protein GLOTRDRAFT_97222 [Gloeophyllum trabeum ATCC 11539]